MTTFGPLPGRRRKRVTEELKFHDASKALTAIVAPTDSAGAEVDPTAGSLNNVATGTTMSSRDGAKIVMKSVQINGVVRAASQATQTAADNGNSVMVALVWDTQTNGAQLNSEDVFTNPLANAVLASHPLRNMSFSRRFKVLKTQVFEFPSLTMVRTGALTTDPIQHGQSGMLFPLNWYVKLPDIVVQWKTTNTDGAITDIIDNSLHLIAFASNSDLACNIAYNSRLRYVG